MPYTKSKDASKIYYETFGDESLYPIILIHPIGGNIDIWEHEIQNSKIKLFGIVANDDKVFLNLMQDMRKDIPDLEIKVIDECDHWMIVENPEAVDEALGEFLDAIKVLA